MPSAHLMSVREIVSKKGGEIRVPAKSRKTSRRKMVAQSTRYFLSPVLTGNPFPGQQAGCPGDWRSDF